MKIKYMAHFFRDISLKRKLLLIYTVFVTIIVLVIGFSTYNVSKGYVEKGETRLLLQNLKQTCSIIDFNLELYLKKSELIFSNTLLQEAISKKYEDIGQVVEAYHEKIYKTLDPIIEEMVYPDMRFSSGLKDGSSSIKVMIYADNPYLKKDGGVIKDMEDYKDEPWMKDIIGNGKRFYWRGLFLEKNLEYISLNRVLKVFSSNKDMGVLSILVPKSRISLLMSQNNENMQGSMYLMDVDGNFISDSGIPFPAGENENERLLMLTAQKEGVISYKAHGTEYILVHTTSDITGWKFFSLMPSNTVTERVKAIKYIVLVVLVVCILLSIFINLLISSLITHRLGKIILKINRLKHDRTVCLDEIPGSDEIGQLDRDFNEMILNLRNMVEKERKSQLQKTGLQVELLQSQINPHLLYNTLSTISWKSKKAGENEVCSATESLIRFFKHFLNKGELTGKISNEIEMIKEYLNILKFTYNMNFETEMDISQQVLDYYSIKLVLQPVVENAIVHGIKPLNHRQGHISITGNITNNSIYFIVKDNGTGIPTEILDRINGGVYASASGGYGLINVMKRIKLYFGEEYGMNVTSRLGEGTEVTVRVPACTREELENRWNKIYITSGGYSINS